MTMRFPKLPDPEKQQRVTELLHRVEAFLDHGRKVPGHILRELALLSDHWGTHRMPPCVVEARAVLGRLQP